MRPPDKAGPAWSAWKLPSAADKPAALGAWIVHCPGLHVAWSYWMVALVHLRDVEGTKPAVRSYPDAELELLSIALNPDKPVDVDGGRIYYLTPPDVAEQFHGVSDAQAIEMLERFVDLIVAGQLAPDSDFRATWKRYVWGTVEHITTGHPRGSA